MIRLLLSYLKNMKRTIFSVTTIMDALIEEDKEHFLLKECDDTNDKLTCTIEGIDFTAFI